VLTPTTPAAEWAALRLAGTVTSVTIASPPVVNFRLTTDQGVPVIGFGSASKASTAKFASYPNLAFSLAKLVPGSGGTPSKWVNYIVTTVETNTTPVGLTRPSTDNTGTLVDNGDGSYTYTFYRDVPGTKALVDSLTAPAGSNKADLGDLTYDANATHRLTIQISGAAPGTGTNTPNAVQTATAVNLQRPVDVIYDFVPATGAAPAASANRKMVANANCESCHSTLGGLPGGDGASLDFHGGGRNNIEYCVVCHTDQRKYGRAEATFNATTRAFSGSTYVVDGRTIGNAPNFIHKIHVGGVMTRTAYNYANVLFDKAHYPQDIRNCDKCHDSTGQSTGGTPLPQASLWKTNANRVACGSCHDGINFDTGVGLTLADKAAGLTVSTGFFGAAHPANSTDGTCLNSSCHNPGAGGDPDLVHKPVTPPNPNNSLDVPLDSELAGSTGNSNTNSAWIASNVNRLPTGAIKVEWDVKSVSLNGSRNPVMVFRWLANGVPTPINAFGPANTNPATGRPEMWTGFMGSPSAQWVWSVPQDGVNAPVDYNAAASVYLRDLWSGVILPAVATLTGPDAEGYYTVTRTGTVVPTTARMYTGGMGYSYNARSAQPLTQTNLAAYPVTNPANTFYTGPLKSGGLIVIAPNKTPPAATAGCDASNGEFGCNANGTFVARRAIVEDVRCNKCHQELGTFTEDAFHAGQRNDGTTCSWCHTPNRASSGWTADSTQIMHAIHGAEKRNDPYRWHAASADASFENIVYPGVLARCEQCHVPGSYDFANTASANAVGLGTVDQLDKRLQRVTASGTLTASFSLAPYVMAGLDYGANLAATNLVLSPTVAVCSGCHDSVLARSHMEVNGGSFYQTRAIALGRTEQCFVCHSSGKIADTKVVHER
jgi:OmcA/MtrC family decaheme c-type cytochrome